MQIPARLSTLTAKALAESLDLPTMLAVAENLVHNYDIHQRTGIPDTVPIQRLIAAQQIVRDIRANNLFLSLVEQIIVVHSSGYMGREYPVQKLRQIMVQLRELGFIYDRENGILVEDPEVRRTRNWGALLEGREYLFAFLRIDIVGNSKLVREHPDDVIQETYKDLGVIVKDVIEKRNGRVWSWEGDGGLVAFCFSNKQLYAATSAMDLVNRIFVYNRIHCRLNGPLSVRIAVHSGSMEYTSREEELKRAEVVKKTVEIEAKHTKPNSATISDTVASTLSFRLIDRFQPISVSKISTYYNYSLRWEK